MTPIYENYRSETPVYFHYATGSKSCEISLFGLLATTVHTNTNIQFFVCPPLASVTPP